MPRELHTAEEIRDEVSRLLNEGRKAPLHVPLPVLLLEPDWTVDPEANWQIPNLPKTAGNELAIRAAILAVKARWNMKR